LQVSPGVATQPASIASPPAEAAEPAASQQLRRSPVLWLTCGSHAVDHFQQQILGVLYPVIMAELGFGYAQLGVLSAIRTLLASACQVVYGFLVPFFRRTRLLAAGSLISGLATAATAFVGSYVAFLGTRALFSLGSSAQHPVGSSLLAGSFTRSRATALALYSSIAHGGGLLAPVAAGLLLSVLGWRQIFLITSLASLAMGLAFLIYRGRSGAAGARAGTRRGKLAEGKASYLRVLRNRNMMVISLVMMVGAAGRGDGVDTTYLGPHLINDLALSAAVAGLALSIQQVGSITGAVGFGWLSDRISRRGVMQASLLLSALSTWWLAHQAAFLPILLLNLVIYGAVTGSRNSLTQALMADSLGDADRDAAFSVYYFLGFISGPVWALVTGFIMEASGFSTAFTVLGFSYLAGMLLLFLIEEPRPAGLKP
jgi:MFS family permease